MVTMTHQNRGAGNCFEPPGRIIIFKEWGGGGGEVRGNSKNDSCTANTAEKKSCKGSYGEK